MKSLPSKYLIIAALLLLVGIGIYAYFNPCDKTLEIVTPVGNENSDSKSAVQDHQEEVTNKTWALPTVEYFSGGEFNDEITGISFNYDSKLTLQRTIRNSYISYPATMTPEQVKEKFPCFLDSQSEEMPTCVSVGYLYIKASDLNEGVSKNNNYVVHAGTTGKKHTVPPRGGGEYVLGAPSVEEMRKACGGHSLEITECSEKKNAYGVSYFRFYSRSQYGDVHALVYSAYPETDGFGYFYMVSSESIERSPEKVKEADELMKIIAESIH